MKSKLISILLILILLVGCSTDDSVTEKPIINNTEKKLSISVCWDHYNIDVAVSRFKKLHPDVEIVVNKYNNDYTKYQNQIVTNLMAGTSDDIVDGTELPYIKLANGGLLTDFYSLMKNDKNFIKNNYYTNVLEAMNYKNKLYMFPVNFIYTMAGINSKMQENSLNTFKTYSNISHIEMLKLYTKSNTELYIDDQFNITNIIASNIDNFIDYENKKCNFNSKEFIDLITETKKSIDPNPPVKEAVTFGLGKPNELDAKKYMFKTIFSSGYEYLLPYKEFTDFVNFIPKSNSEGKIYMYPTMRFSISEKSKNKELAWEFLKFLTTQEANKDAPFGKTFSINKDTFKMITTNSINNYINDLETQANIFLDGDKEKHVTDLVNYFDKIVQKPMKYASTETYLDIIIEDADKFNKGLMTAEQLASDLQNKISLSLME